MPKKPLFIFILFFIFFSWIGFNLITKHKDKEVSGLLHNKEKVLLTNMKALYHTHKEVADFIYDSHLNSPKIINILKDAQDHPEQVRAKLLEELSKLYGGLKKMGLRQFHFHLPNGDSFLRFHRPNRFGDNLFKYRETVANVSKYHNPIYGFEMGKIFGGLRFVYPLFSQKYYIGSVEVSFNSGTLIDEFIRLFPLDYTFIIKKDISDKKLFQSEKNNYTESCISDNYYTEKNTRNSVIEDFFKNHDFKDLDKKLTDKDSFVISVIENDTVKTVIFIAIKNPITNNNIAFVVCAEDDYILYEIQQEYYYILSMSFLIVLATFLFLYRELKLRTLLEKKNEEINTILRKANTAIATIDLDGNYLTANDYLCKTLEYDKEEMLRKNYRDLTKENDIDKVTQNIKKVKEEGVVNKIQKACISKSKKIIHFEFNLRLLPDGKSFVAIGNSLEDKMQIEEQNKILLSINNNLKHKIQEEVEKNLEQNRLHQEKQLEDAKFTSIGQLAAGITHEINTPLTYIKANFEMMTYDIVDLPESDIKARMIEDSSGINDGINRLSNIVESMREMSQKSQETKEQTNLYSSLITALTMAHNRSKQISQIYLQGELFKIGMDKDKYIFDACVQRQRIEQVWIVIINNALDELVKIEPFEKRKIDISIVSKKTQQIICIKDNAGGIDKKILLKIFEPFESAKKSSGMGIGLNIAKKIIEDQKGEIRAYNKGDGAIFEVKLSME